MAKFPNLVFVKWESGGTDEDYMAVYANPQEASEQNETTTVGLYQFVGKRKIINSTKVAGEEKKG